MFWLILFPLLILFIISFFSNSRKVIGKISIGTTLLCCLSILYIFITKSFPLINSFQWLSIEKGITLSVGFQLDKLSVVIGLVVCFITLLVQIYSLEYVKNEGDSNRYWGFLSLFLFAMLWLVFAKDLLTLFIGWELVGFCSYFLITFYIEKEEVKDAGMWAFLSNRVADGALLIGILLLLVKYETLDFSQLYILVNKDVAAQNNYLTLAGILLLAGCLGKSAQIPFQIWLPKAMVGPTPVSALLHSATMVAAGVYLLAKVSPILTPFVLQIALYVGVITAFIAALFASGETNLKKILAYSTISQLGLMIMIIGAGASPEALFHLITHAFFKAGLFLCIGLIILEIKPNKLIFISLLIMGASLAGVPFTSGFLSKEAILDSLIFYQAHTFVIVLFYATALLTAFYIFKLIKTQYSRQFQRSTINYYYSIPILVLAFLSLWLIYSPIEFWYWQKSVILSYLSIQYQPIVNTNIPISWNLLLIGCVVIGVISVPKNLIPTLSIATKIEGFYLFIFLKPVLLTSRAGVFIDKNILDKMIDTTASIVSGWKFKNNSLANLADKLDRQVIDWVVNSLANLVLIGGVNIQKIQTGQIQTYLLFTLGVVLLLFIFIFVIR